MVSSIGHGRSAAIALTGTRRASCVAVHATIGNDVTIIRHLRLPLLSGGELPDDGEVVRTAESHEPCGENADHASPTRAGRQNSHRPAASATAPNRDRGAPRAFIIAAPTTVSIRIAASCFGAMSERRAPSSTPLWTSSKINVA